MSISTGKASRRLVGRLFLGLILGGVAIYFLPNSLLAVYTDRSQESNTQPADDSSPEKKRSHSIKFEYVPGEVLVKFRKNVSSREMASIHTQVDTEELGTIPIIRVRRVRGRRGQSTEELIQMYSKRPEVEYVEPNGIVHTQLTPNDSRFSELWGLNNIGQTGGTFDADIDAPEAWDLQTGSSSVIVADIDTGVDYNHPDLAANIWTNPGEIPGNGIDDDGNGYIDDVHGWNFVNNTNDPFDDNGHGTHTAGTIAAAGNNGTGVVGVNWRAKIMPVKFADASGNGTFANAASAILYASQMGAKISNNSWGCGPASSGCFSQAVQDALEVAYQRGMLFVVAAGNSNNNNDIIPTYPCNNIAPNVLCVAATDHNDQKASFSNYGAATVVLGAPGVNILSTVPTGSCSLCDVSGYKLLNGTSMATPHVAGAAALVLSQFPGLTIDQIKSVLIGSVDSIPAMTGITQTGGRLNVNNAVRSSFIVTANPDIQTIVIGQATNYTVNLQSLNSFNSQVTLSLASPDPNITGSFSANPVILPANGSVQVTLTVTTTTAAARGTYLLTIRGTSPLGETHATTIELDLTGPDFAISVNPASRTTGPAGTTTYAVSVSSFEGYSAPVTLSMTATDPNISGSFSLNPVTAPANSTVASSLNVTTTASVPLTNHTLTIQATDGVKTRTQTAILAVTDVDLIMSAVSGPSIVAPGNPITISDTVKNNGTGNASGFNVGYYLLPNAAITSPSSGKGNGLLEPKLAMNGSGNAIAVWEENRNIFANRYDVSTNTWGAPILIQINPNNHARRPQVAMDDDGNSVTVWEESNHIWANHYTAATNSWGTAIQIDANPGPGSRSPRIAMNSSGNAVVVWGQVVGTLSNQYWASYYMADTKSWGTPTQIETNLSGGFSTSWVSVAMNDSDNAVAVWEEGTGIWANHYDNSTHNWQTDRLIKSGSDGNGDPQVAMDGNGNAIAVWGHSAPMWIIRYVASTHSWDLQRMFATQQGITSQVAMDGSGNAVIVWQSYGNIWAIRYTASTNSWDSPTLIESNAGSPQIAMDGSGNAVAVWRQDGNGSLSNIWAIRSVANTNSWSTPTLIDSNTGKANYPQVALDGSGNAVAVWSQQNDGQVYNIWANRYVISTNSWGTPTFIEPFYLGSRSVSGLAGGATDSGSTTMTIPNVAEGTYYIGAVADDTNLVPEGNETNNGLASNNPIIISLTAPPTTTTTTTITTTSTTTTTTTTIPNQPPSADTLTPVNITTAPGVAQSFTATYSDPDGWQNLWDAFFTITGGKPDKDKDNNQQVVRYSRSTNSFTLSGASGGCTPGQAPTLSSSALTLNCGASTASGSGNTLTVTFSLTPKPFFSGPHPLTISVSDIAMASNGKSVGRWTVHQSRDK